MPVEHINPGQLWDAAPRGYSHIVKVSMPQNLIFVSGQAAVDTDLNILSETVEGQTTAIFEHLAEALKDAGATLADIVDMTIYLTDIATQQWPVREARAKFFEPGKLPTSTMIEVSRFALDTMLIEIDVIAAT
jgi:2-iminobutanoate/2-iminopropanoate deaminase